MLPLTDSKGLYLLLKQRTTSVNTSRSLSDPHLHVTIIDTTPILIQQKKLFDGLCSSS